MNTPRQRSGSSFALLLHGLAYAGIGTANLLVCAHLSDQGLIRAYHELALLVFVILGAVFGRFSLISRWHIGRAGAIGTGVMLNWLAVATGLVFLGFITRQTGVFERRVILIWLVTTPLLFIAAHHIARYIFFRWFPNSMRSRRAVIVFLNDGSRRLAETFRDLDLPRFNLLGFFEDRAAIRTGEPVGGLVLGRCEDVVDYVNTNAVDVVFVVLPLEGADRAMSVVSALGDTTASIYFVPASPLFRMDHLQFAEFGGMPVFTVSETPFFGADGLLKRMMDITFALILITLLAPVFAVVATAVLISSGRPILFTQPRYGLDGREIAVHKFRTMHVAEVGALVNQATRNDPRVTPLGAFLRRTSIDELPQFWNVLRGEMSLVGPRPHAVSHNETYRGLVSQYMLRHKVKPGLTGLAQINGLRGETARVEDMQRRVEYDLRYIRSWSPGLDIYIILRTIALVFRDRAAY